MSDKRTVSCSPHIRDNDTTSRIMWAVFFSLMPAVTGAVFFFGFQAILVCVTSVLSAVAAEALVQKIMNKPVTIHDGSAAVTGLLLACVLSASTPLYMVCLGSAFAIIIVKQLFGGLGANIWNPALAARAFLQAAYSEDINSGWAANRYENYFSSAADTVSSATPLSALKEGAEQLPSYADLFFGTIKGCLGETSALLLLIGAAFLFYKKCINWRMPVIYIASVALLAWILPDTVHNKGWLSGDPLFHVLAGGLIIGAFFMATDMVTTPLSNRGIIVFALGAGILTSVIRIYGGYPEGVCYSILLMNTATPLIDRFTRPRVFGT